jgi:hypothetical protein
VYRLGFFASTLGYSIPEGLVLGNAGRRDFFLSVFSASHAFIFLYDTPLLIVHSRHLRRGHGTDFKYCSGNQFGARKSIVGTRPTAEAMERMKSLLYLDQPLATGLPFKRYHHWTILKNKWHQL